MLGQGSGEERKEKRKEPIGPILALLPGMDANLNPNPETKMNKKTDRVLAFFRNAERPELPWGIESIARATDMPYEVARRAARKLAKEGVLGHCMLPQESFWLKMER